MANTDFVRGLVPLRHQGGQPYNDAVNMYYVPASDATALFIGDPVILAGSADAAGVPSVTRASGTGAITGVVVGFVPDGTTNIPGYRAASTAGYVLVNDNPETIFEIQDTAGTIAAADIGLNANLTINAGSATTRRSGVVLASASKATTATLPVKILGLRQMPNNDFGAYAKLLVKINVHTMSTDQAGI